MENSEFSTNFELNELKFEFDLDTADFGITEIDLQDTLDSRYIKPPRSKNNDDQHCKYDNAIKLAQDIVIKKDSRHFVIINGTFIFGDFIEALLHAKGWNAKRVIISTLSMSMNNVDSLANLINWGWVDKLDLIVSDYFYSHERKMLIPYLYEKCDIDNKFQLAAARTHCKTVTIETYCGLNIVIHGSANLRTSGNLEQICIEENSELCKFNVELQENILERFSTIDKSLSKKETWQAVATVQEKRVG